MAGTNAAPVTRTKSATLRRTLDAALTGAAQNGIQGGRRLVDIHLEMGPGQSLTRLRSYDTMVVVSYDAGGPLVATQVPLA